MIGHTETSFNNYEQQCTFWNIKLNKQIDDKDHDKKRNKEKKEKDYRSDGDLSDNQDLLGGDLVDMKSVEDDEL